MTDPHHCDTPGPCAFQGYGDAIDEGCHEDDRGFFWVGNGEYGSPVAYCPHCGTKAPRDPRRHLPPPLSLRVQVPPRPRLLRLNVDVPQRLPRPTGGASCPRARVCCT